ncbi:MAG: hypothetical protein EOP46_10425 [Sphingobacteriaceae bacterium]|nr:MAG: hypothetical protein EOP46_10425 [Sphingobacteriaceae bacterium]
MNITGNTHFKLLLAILSFVFIAGCGNSAKQQQDRTDTTQAVLAETPTTEDSKSTTTIGDCKAADTLLYSEDGVFSSYTEDKMRGVDVISFQLDINDRLDIYNVDGSKFGFLVYNDDQTYYLQDMPAKIIARAVIPVTDLAQFDFDAEVTNTDKDYLIIYVNREKRKVKKADVKFTFRSWEDYLKLQEIRLKSCNMLPEAGTNQDLVYQVTQVKGDEIKIRSVKNCSGEDEGFKQVEGWIKWKNGDSLTVNLTSCD